MIDETYSISSEEHDLALSKSDFYLSIQLSIFTVLTEEPMDIEPAIIASKNWFTYETECYIAGWRTPEVDSLAIANVTFSPDYMYDPSKPGVSIYTNHGKIIVSDQNSYFYW